MRRSQRLSWDPFVLQVGGAVHPGSTSSRAWNPLELLQAHVGQRWHGGGSLTIDLLPEELGPFFDLQILRSAPNGVPPALPLGLCARWVAQRLSISKSDLAKLFGISRPTLYAWINGEAEPREESHRGKLAVLGSLIEELFGSSVRPLFHRFVYEPMPNEPRSLFQVLEAERWDPAELRRLLTEALGLTRQRDQRLGQPPDQPREVKEHNLQDNLLSLGGE
jgi:transcriptional regulator with XRE-family HTH domain